MDFKVINDIAYNLKDPTCHIRHANVADIHLLMPAGYTVSMLADIKALGWVCKYTNDPFFMPDLKWQNSNPSNVWKIDQTADTSKHRNNL